MDLMALSPISVSREEAAKALGVSIRTFERSVQPHLKLVSLDPAKRNARKLVPVSELRRYVDENSVLGG